MVKFRGIEICVVSQLDIQRLPEFAHRTSPVSTFDATSASCFIPVLPGCQIWFEYSIDGPHPPKSAYFFKLFVNHHFITAWDCTSKHHYRGKMTYCLQTSKTREQQPWPYHVYDSNVERRGLQFANVDEDDEKLITLQDDCVEIRVYRIEHRQRIRTDFTIPAETLSGHEASKLRLVSGGLLEPSRPQRRYKYQLLDPLDAPFATFRYFYRSSAWLDERGLVSIQDQPADDSLDSPTLWFDPGQGELPESSPSGYGSPDYNHSWNMVSS